MSYISDLPDVFLPYQQELWTAIDENQVVVVEKSRRTGYSWAVAAVAVEYAARSMSERGTDVVYMGYDQDMTREFISYCAMWAKEFETAAGEVEETLWTNPDKPEVSIQVFRIAFGSGFEIIALPSVARALRGKQAVVIIDEAAFADELDAVLKAAFAHLIWGGKVVVISTHNGDANPFNVLVQDIRAGKKPGYKLLRLTFDQADAQGLYDRVCLRQGIARTEEGHTKWRAGIFQIYGDNADEELHVIPAAGSGVFLTTVLLEQRAIEDDIVLRWTAPKDFESLNEFQRAAEVQSWINEELLPRLARLDPTLPHALGEDFGRIIDLTVMWILAICRDLVRRTRLVVELRNMPFRQQEQVLFAICDRLPRFRAAKMDRGGNGAFLAEVAVTRYGERVEGIQLSEGWYRDHMPKMKTALDEGTMTMPRDSDVVDDFRMLKLVRGVARVPDRRRDDTGAKRHGDAAIAGCLAYAASIADVEIIGYTPVAPARSMFDMPRAETWLGGPRTRSDFEQRQRRERTL